MSDKFLNTGGSGTNISNGTANVYAAVLGAVNLNASMPIKTNSTKQLVSEKLDIADIQNLSSQLSLKPELTFIESDTHSTPALGKVKIYAKLDGNMYKKNDQGVESGIGGGGGGGGGGDVVGPISSVDNAVAFFDGTTGKLIKENTDFKFITGATYGPQLKVPDIVTDDHFSVNTELQKITNFTAATEGATPITNITGELDVKKIKSYEHNVEIEFDNNDLTMTADGSIDINSTGNTQIASGSKINLVATSSIEMNKTLNIQGANQYDSQIKFKDTTQTREQAAVGFISGDGTNGLKWILGGAGDLNKVLFRTYASNDDLQFDTQGINTMTLSSTGDLTLARGGLITDTVTAGLGGKINLVATSSIEMNKTLNIQGANQYDSQIKFKDTTQTREQAAVGFISGDGTNGLKWILGGAGDLNKVLFRTYASNDDLQFDTQGINTMTLSSTGDLTLARGGLITDTVSVAGSGSIQRPFTILNPTYNKSLQVERQALGMGLLWKDNDITQSYISSQDEILNIFAGSNLNLATGLGGKIIGLPFDLVFSATDEVNTITTTGQKMQLVVPRDFTTSKIKLSVNTIGGVGFSVVVKKNAVVVATIAMNNNFVTNTTSVETYSENATITLEISNVGSGTATGLKCYLIGKTI